ncbi:MAG: hypothetical protein F6K35_09340 [Okeania sp. SIO2H7]|nr:hypothetical protein [Okeania sp. SIO2H7]
MVATPTNQDFPKCCSILSSLMTILNQFAYPLRSILDLLSDDPLLSISNPTNPISLNIEFSQKNVTFRGNYWKNLVGLYLYP